MREKLCPDCGEERISPEQDRIIGVCLNCEQQLRSSWARMDRDYYERRDRYA